jgi:enoyl-CoA hydratase/carnithine racemase
MSLVITEDRGAVRHVVLNRSEKRNAMNQELLGELSRALRAAADDGDVHCVVLRGEGPVFSAGVDLVELAASAGQTSALRPFRTVFLECANLCESMTKPVICEMHRICVGGALEVALGCDLRIASSDCMLGLPEVKFGIIPDVGGSTRLPAVVGLGRAKELIMTARLIDAGEAERIGLVNRVVAPEQLRESTDALVEELLAHSHLAIGRAKRVIDASARPTIAQSLEMEIDVQEYLVAAARESMREAQDAAATAAEPAATEPAATAPAAEEPAAAEPVAG